MLAWSLKLAVNFRFPVERDIVMLARDMRQSDRDELAVVCDLTPLDAVWASVLASDQRFLSACLDGEELLCIVGCTPDNQGAAKPWLLATEKMDAGYCKRLTREAREGLAKMLAVYPRLYNFVDVRQVQTIRWLEALGFGIGARQGALHGEVFYFGMGA
jgi:hypothetical protein